MTPFFSEPKTAKKEIPAPHLCLVVVKKQWTKPVVFPHLGSKDKRFCNFETDFSQILQVPTVDPPVIALAFPTSLVAEAVADSLLADDRRTEMMLRMTLQSAAWASGQRSLTPSSNVRLSSGGKGPRSVFLLRMFAFSRA